MALMIVSWPPRQTLIQGYSTTYEFSWLRPSYLEFLDLLLELSNNILFALQLSAESAYLTILPESKDTIHP